MSKPHKIEKLYAWIITHADGEDGIPAIHTSLGALPMIGSDKERIESFRAQAMATAEERGLPIRLVEFSGVKVLEQHAGKW